MLRFRPSTTSREPHQKEGQEVGCLKPSTATRGSQILLQAQALRPILGYSFDKRERSTRTARRNRGGHVVERNLLHLWLVLVAGVVTVTILAGALLE